MSTGSVGKLGLADDHGDALTIGVANAWPLQGADTGT
jgi:hypothetical protein